MASAISDYGRSPEFAQLSTEGFVETHWKSYTRVVNDCCVALSSVWTDVGLSLAEVESELNSIAGKTTAVWSASVAIAEQQKNDLVDNIRRLEMEISALRAQLDEPIEFECWKPSLSLKQRLEQVNKLKTEAKELKAARIMEFKDVLSKIACIRAQFGQPFDDSLDFDDVKCNLSRESLELLKCDLESFYEERTRRLQTLESLWRSFKILCTDLGEDPHEMIKSVHSSLEFVDQRFAGGLKGRRLFVELCFGLESSATWRTLQLPCLSQETFTLIEEKLSWLRNERAGRETILHTKKESLESLWDALQLPQDDLDRIILSRLVEGPARLHRKTLEKVDEEIRRQEKVKARVLKMLVDKKLDEIERVCAAGRLELPKDVQRLIEEERNHQADQPSNPYHYAEALGTLNRLIADARTLVQKRTDIIALIEEFENARREVEWLIEYEQDDDRYKGRDCNRKLNRALKAGKLRERMPAAHEKLRGVILEWEKSERKPFILDGVDYRVAVLDTFDLIIATNHDRQSSVSKTTNKTPTAKDACTLAGKTLGFVSEKKRRNSQVNSRFSCLTEGRSPELRPKTSAGQSMLRDPQTDYDPLQDRLDQVLKGPHSVPPPRTKSTIPLTPKLNRKTRAESGLFMTPRGQEKKNTKVPMESEDEIMEDAFMVGKKGQPRSTAPTPRGKQSSSYRNHSKTLSPDKETSTRRCTF